MRFPKYFQLLGSLALSAIATQSYAATCTYKVDNEWNTGFVASITITNNTNTAISGWNVNWKYNTNKVTYLWNGVFSGANPYTAGSLDWNANIQPGQAITFGFQGDKNGAASAEIATVTGAVCSGASSSQSSSAPQSSSSSSKSSVVSSSSSVVSSSSSVIVSSSSSSKSSSSLVSSSSSLSSASKSSIISSSSSVVSSSSSIIVSSSSSSKSSSSLVSSSSSSLSSSSKSSVASSSPVVSSSSSVIVSSSSSSKSSSSLSSIATSSQISSSASSGTAINAAMLSGDAKLVTKAEVKTEIQRVLTTSQINFSAIKRVLFGLNADGSTNSNSVGAIDWYPGRAATYLQGLDMMKAQSVLPNNWEYGGNTASTDAQALALVGRSAQGTANYAVFGGHPFGVPGNVAMSDFMVNTVKWLTGKSSVTGLKVVVAQQPYNYESTTRTWFASRFPGITINGISTNPATQPDNSCDNAMLAACLKGVDLLIIGQDEGSNYNGTTFIQTINAAFAQGIPVLYTHSSWGLSDVSNRLFGALGIFSPDTYAGNYFARYGLKAFMGGNLSNYPPGLDNISTLIDRLELGNFTTDWSGCTNYVGSISCDKDSLYMSQFGSITDKLRTSIRSLDENGTAIFSQNGYTLEKLLILLGDKYRTDVAYSSTFTKENNPRDFFRSLFSDVTSYMTRGYSSVAKNLGNFSGLFADNITTAIKSVTVTPPISGSTEYATGLYILPGKTVTITRTDSGTESVSFGVNMLRDTSRPFVRMDRPTQISSPRPVLLPNKSVTITNSYGGPLYLFIGGASGQPDVKVQVTNVITHPILRNPSDAVEVASFQKELNSTPTNWVVLATEMVTLHSNLPKFKESLATYTGNLTNLATDTWTYFVKDTYELAGFNSASGKFSLPKTVADFCTSKGWNCASTQHRRDEMQHVIADEWAYCGDGCSGNPYDQDWAFEPLGWGETHEVGHNLQVDRLSIYSDKSGEVSNNIFPLHKHIKYNKDKGSMVYEDRKTIDGEQPTYCTNRNASVAACVFGIMKSAQTNANPTTFVYNAIWSNTSYAVNNSERVLFYRQLVEFARYYNPSFSDGWELYTLMYLLERDFSHSSTSTWAADASKLGLGTYTTYPSTMDGNDFMVIAASNIVGRDMRPVFDLWGVTYSSAASAQVSAYGLAAASKFIFPMKSLSTYGSGVAAPVSVTGTAAYPAGY